jgi:hypothetical protein
MPVALARVPAEQMHLILCDDLASPLDTLVSY